MDELTASILATIKEQKEYPERFTYAMICDGCGRRYEDMTSKEEIAKYKVLHPEIEGVPELHTWECEKCAAKDDDDE